MNKVIIRITLFLFITGMLLVMYGCPLWTHRCERWATRTAYRQVCKSWSGTHCSFWGTESYQETYCTRWIKDPELRKTPDSKLPPGKFIRKAGEAHFPKNTGVPTAGETYLLTQLVPFICEIVKSDGEIMKSDDVIKTLASMGQYNIDERYTSSRQGEFITKNFTGGFTLYEHKTSTSSLWFKPTYKNSWPFTDEELADLLSSLGLKVMRDHVSRIVGVAGKKSGRNRYSSLSYEFSIGMENRHYGHKNRYDTAPYDSSNDVMEISWKNPYKSKTTLACKKVK
jgi:hypothetical protein